MFRPETMVVEWLASQKRAKERANLRQDLTTPNWWKEVAGTFILAARQTGKTTALNNFIGHLKTLRPNERVVAVAPYQAALEKLPEADLKLKARAGTSWLGDINTNTDHLVVDEFMFLKRETLDLLLSFEWQSVTMIGGVK